MVHTATADKHTAPVNQQWEYEAGAGSLNGSKRSLKTEKSDQLPLKRPRSNSHTVSDWLERIEPIAQQPQTFSRAESPILRLIDLDPISTLLDDMPSEAVPAESTSANSEDGDIPLEAQPTRDGAINADHPFFIDELESREIIVLLWRDKSKPENYDEFVAALRQDRTSAEPEEQDRIKISRRIEKATYELDFVRSVLPSVLQVHQIWDNDDLYMVPSSIWDEEACIPHPLVARFPLVAPQADEVIGWRRKTWRWKGALRLLGRFASSLAAGQCYFPSVALEGMGPEGVHNVAEKQCLHDGASMLWSLYNVSKAAGTHDDFRNKIRAITIMITTESLQLYYHWLVKTEDDKLLYHAKSYEDWSLRKRNLTGFNDGRRSIRDAVDWMMETNKAWIDPVLKIIEDKFNEAVGSSLN